MALKENFLAANLAGDGHLTKKEAEAAGMKQLVANFEKIDLDGVGYVTFEQAKRFKAEKKASVAQAGAAKAQTEKRKAKLGT